MKESVYGSRRQERFPWLAVIFVAAAVLYICAAVPGMVGFYHDDAIYVVTAKALAQGEGYRIISLPQSWPQTKYPVFYPFLLSLVWRLYPEFPNNLMAMKLVSVFSSLLFLYVAHRFLTRFHYASPGAARGIIILAAFSPWALYFSSMILSEMPYALLSIIALYLVESALSPELKTGKSYLLILMAAGGAGLAYLTRSVGITVILSIFLFLTYQRAWKLAFSFFAASLLLAVPWHLWTHLQLKTFAPASGLETYYLSYTGWFSEHLDGFLSWKIANVLFRNILSFLLKLPGLVFFPLSFTPVPKTLWLPEGLPSALFFLSVLLLVVAVGVALRNNHYQVRLLDVYLMVYLLAVWIWPWPCMRFLVPVFPFLMFTLYRVAVWLVPFIRRQIESSKRTYAVQIFQVVVISSVLINGSVNLAFIEYSSLYGQPFLPFSDVKIPERKAYEHLFQWIRKNTPPDAILSGGHDPMYYLYTGRRAISEFSPNPYKAFYAPASASIESEAEEIERNLKRYKVDYLIVIAGLEPPLKKLVSLMNEKGHGLLEQVFENEEKSISVYRIIWNDTKKLLLAE
jgi:hypothetical protein